MAEALVSAVLKQLISVAAESIGQEVRLVVGVDKEVEKLRNNFEAVQAVLVDAEARQVKETTVRLWLDRLKQASYDVEDVLDEWNYALLEQRIKGVENDLIPGKKKLCFSFPSSCFSFKKVSLRHDIVVRIKEVNEKLDNITKQKDLYDFHMFRSVETSERVQSTTFIDVSEIYGRVEEKSILINKLCESCEKHLPSISLIGMGGIGKTTLAQLAYNDNNVIKKFDERIWVCVSEPFDVYRIAKAIIEALEGSAPNLSELNSLLQRISRSIEGKKILLVLDDMWTEDYKNWEPLCHCLNNSFHGSKILITTRKKSVVDMVGLNDKINVNVLTDDECWLLFKQLAFFGRPNEECEKLDEIGRKISSKCKGLPLAAKALGSLLRFKKRWEEWKSVLDSELWELRELEDVFLPLLLSYNDLPCMIKRCFVYCAIFPKDYVIDKDELIKLWMAQEYLKEEKNKAIEIVGEEYFDYLASRSLFQEFEKDDENNIIRCKMHDLVHDFAQFLSKNECLHIKVGGSKDPVIDSSYHDKVCHVMVTIYSKNLFPDSFFSLKKMCSFFNNIEDLKAVLPSSNILPKLLGELTCLKALSMIQPHSYDENLIEDIPKEVGKLIHLRYLNLWGLGMRKLPEALCGLYNLQTLNISWCRQLEELPQGMGKLINLRHLQNEGTWRLRYIPVGIQRLTNLRTLDHFVVNGGNDEKACSLEGLRYLNLFGKLCIGRLGKVSDLDEIRRLKIKNQENLVDLTLDFSKDCDYGDGDGRERTNEDDETLLEFLQPSLNLEKLYLFYYRGNTILPTWMMSLTKLKHLSLSRCSNCKLLPPLGKLPSLESLDIGFMGSLKRVGNEFLRKESDGTSSSFIFFPKLKTITFVAMPKWEEWDYEITRIGEEEEEVISIMPSLVSLTIAHCPKLKALPKHLAQDARLKKDIWGCPMLGDR